MRRLLSGIRVIESSMLLNGASTTMMLADLGADVIKVESPFLGDYIRLPHTLPLHLQVNKNKRSVALDLRKAAGQEVFYRLLSTADVFVTNATADKNVSLGISHDQMRARKPDIIYCQNTGYGATGPYATVPTHGQMMDAIAGATPMEVDEHGLVGPSKAFEARWATLLAGGEATATGAIYAAFHIAAALVRRAETGEGAYIDVSAAAAVLASAWTGVARLSRLPKAERSYKKLDPAVARYQWYRTRDEGYILFCPEEKKFWVKFCDLVGRPDLKNRERGLDLRTEIQAIISTRNSEEWIRIAVEHHLPLGPSHNTLDDVLADPQIRSLGILSQIEDVKYGPVLYVQQPAMVDGESFDTPRPAPELGEQTSDVLLSLGYTRDDLERLAEAEVTASSSIDREHISVRALINDDKAGLDPD